MKVKNSEKGQIIVILALSMVAIIAITALAIDGSLIYNVRRQDQNTADSAALAGAGAAANYLKNITSGTLICGTPVGTAVTLLAVNAVQASVALDGIAAADMPILINDTELAEADQGFTVTCKWYETLGTQYLDIHVKISSEMETNFGGVINQDTLRTSVESTARVYPRQPFAYGNGLVSLNDTTCGNGSGGIYFLGGGQLGKKGTYITNGGVFSNSCISAQSGIVQVTGGAIQYNEDFQCTGCAANPKVQPEPIPATTKLPKNMYPAPTCPRKAGDNTHNSNSYNGTISPGWYTKGISTPNGAALTLEPGLYCIEGGMTNNSKSSITGNGVTLYFKSGDVKLNQNNAGDIILTSCIEKTCGSEKDVQNGWSSVPGMLMYFDNYAADVQFNGSSTNIFKGTVFGPLANFTLNGNTDTLSDELYNFSTQIIGNSILVNGNAMLVMNLNSSDFTSLDPSLSLVK